MANLAYRKEPKTNSDRLEEAKTLLSRKGKDGSFSLPSTGFNVTYDSDAEMLDLMAKAQTMGLFAQVLEDEIGEKKWMVVRRVKSEIIE